MKNADKPLNTLTVRTVEDVASLLRGAKDDKDRLCMMIRISSRRTGLDPNARALAWQAEKSYRAIINARYDLRAELRSQGIASDEINGLLGE